MSANLKSAIFTILVATLTIVVLESYKQKKDK